MAYTEVIEFCIKENIKYLENESMKKHTSFKTGGVCKLMVFPVTVAEIIKTVRFFNSISCDFICIGNGTNLIVPEGKIDKIIISISSVKSEITVSDDVIYAEAGASVTAVCNVAKKHSLSGLEFAYGIPGSVGGGVYMNAGAYGGEFKDVVFETGYITKDGKEGVIIGNNHEFGYRKSVYSNSDNIILYAKFKLNFGDKEEIAFKMNDFMQRRIDKQPLDYPSAGSTFKRPEGYFAGALIEQSDLKGYSIGGAQVSEKHCGFVINKGDATSDDIINLIDYIKKTVKHKTGVDLTPEVKFLEM